jgi:hypothetical protein
MSSPVLGRVLRAGVAAGFAVLTLCAVGGCRYNYVNTAPPVCVPAYPAPVYGAPGYVAPGYYAPYPAYPYGHHCR